MPDNGEAVFQEVVQVTLGYDQFTADLQKIEDAWDAALQRMNDSAQGAGIDPTQLLNSEAFSVDVSNLQEQIQGLAESMGTAFGAVASTLTETMDRVEQATSRATASLENLNNTKSRIQGVGTVGTPVGTEEAETTAEFERNYQRRQAAAQVLEEQLAELRRTDSEANKNAADESTADFNRAYQIRADIAKKVEADIAARHKEIQAELRAEDDESTAEFVRNYQIRQEVAAKFGSELAVLAEEQAVANRGFFGDFMAGFSGSGTLGEMVGSVARFATTWAAVGAAINGIVEAIKSIPAAIANGIEYTRQLEEKTADIQGVIAANITYTKDWAENFRLAGEEAQQVVKALQDAAIKDALNPEQLQKAFKALLEGGGGQMAENMNQLVQLTTMFGMAMKAAGKDAEGTRALISELPKLMEGTISDSSKLLEVLHLNKQEWEQIRQTSLQHHDLLAQLAPRMAPYLTVVQQAELRQTVLKEQVDLMLQRLEAAGSQPLFDLWTTALTAVKGLLEDHKVQITSILSGFSELGVQAFTMVAHLGDSKILLQAIANIVMILITGFTNLLSIIGQIVGDLGSIIDFMGQISRNPFKLDNWKTAFDDLFEHIKSNWNETAKTFNQGADNLEAFATGRGPLVQGGLPADRNVPASELNGAQQRPTLLDRNYESARGPRDVGDLKAELQTLKAEYKQAVEQVKGDTQEAIDAIKQAISANTITVEDGETKIIAALKSEEGVIADLTDRYELKAAAFGKAGDKAATEFAAEFQKLDNTLGKQLDDAGNTIVKHQVKLSQDITAESLKEAQRRSQGELQAVKDAAAQGLLLKSEAATKELEISKDIHDQKMQLLELEQRQYAVGTDAYIKMQRQMEAEAQNYYNTVAHLAEQHTAALRQEEQQEIQIRRQTLQVSMQEAEAEAGLIPNKIENSARLLAAEQKILEIKRQLLDVAVQDAARQVAEAVAIGKTADEVKRLENNLHAAEAARRAAIVPLAQQAGQASVNAHGAESVRNGAEQSALQQQLQDLQKQHEELQKLYVAYVELERVLPNSAAALKSLDDAIKSNEQSQDDIRQTIDSSKISWDNIKSGLERTIPVLELYKVWHDKNLTSLEKFGTTLEKLSQSITNISGIVQNIQAGFQNGGALGGAGAISSTVGGIFSSIGGALGPWGIGLSAAGSVLGFISGLFEGAAKRIAKEIEDSIKNINLQAQEGVITLGQQIQQLEQQRIDAINRLSGEKGGDDKLKEILNQLDPEIAQLKKQQQDITTAFRNEVIVMRQTGDAAQQWMQNWIEINNRVKEYLGAGGNPKFAQEFLQEKLASMRQQITDQYDQNERQAIQDSLNLNDLLKQRQNLLDQIKNLSQGVQDSIERREAGAITAIRANQQQKQQLMDQLDALNQQISVATVRVQKEQQLFGLTNDIAALRKKDAELQLKALDEQMVQWTALAKLIKSVSGPFGISPAGYFYGGNPFGPAVPGGIPGFGATASAPVIHISGPIYIHGSDSYSAGRDFGRGIYEEYAYRFRQGLSY